jgi:hypothetical protein
LLDGTVVNASSSKTTIRTPHSAHRYRVCPSSDRLRSGGSSRPSARRRLDANLVAERKFQRTSADRCHRLPGGSLQCVSDRPEGFEWCVNVPASTGTASSIANSDDGRLHAIGQGQHGVFTKRRQTLFLNRGDRGVDGAATRRVVDRAHDRGEQRGGEAWLWTVDPESVARAHSPWSPGVSIRRNGGRLVQFPAGSRRGRIPAVIVEDRAPLIVVDVIEADRPDARFPSELGKFGPPPVPKQTVLGLRLG